MPGFFAMSIDSKEYKGVFLDDLFWQTFYQQHMGESYAGLATYNSEKISIRTHRGLFRSNFGEDMAGLEGTMGIGYCGDNREPILVDSKLGEFAICYSGNIINQSELVAEYKERGHSFAWGGTDVEIIAKLIAEGDGFADGIRRMNNRVKGAYSIAILASEGIYMACDPSGRWPLVIGEKGGAIAATTDPTGFSNFGFNYQRDIEPGEIVLLRGGKAESKGIIQGGKSQICTFVWVYTNFPNAVFKGIPVTAVRKRLGAILARRDIENGFIPDVVAPVPDSGRFCAIGYHQEFCRQINEGKINQVPLYDEILIKYPYAGRSYPRLTQSERDMEARIKQLRSGENYAGKKVVICDDSIRRGTQIERNLVPKLRALNISEIHIRVSNPDSVSYCRWGKTVRKGELIATRIPSLKRRVEFLGIDSLTHPTVEELAKAIGLPLNTLCVDCDLPGQQELIQE
jgi:amidophosphoribosyltransferase